MVFGSRFAGGESHRVLYFWHYAANKMLTLASNMFTNLNLTDMETCYKAFRREIIQRIDIKEDRFGFEPEVTAKVAKSGCRIYEVGSRTRVGRTRRARRSGGKTASGRCGAFFGITFFLISHQSSVIGHQFALAAFGWHGSFLALFGSSLRSIGRPVVHSRAWSTIENDASAGIHSWRAASQPSPLLG